MRVLWITYEPIGNTAQVLNGSTTQSGSWVDATASLLVSRKSAVELGIATIFSRSLKMIDPETAVAYYGVSGVRRLRGRRDGRSAVQRWSEVIDDFKPDIIQIWGTEFSNGLDVAEAASGIPMVIFIQGVMRAIARYRYGNLPLLDVWQSVGLPDRIKCVKLKMNQKDIDRQVAFEEQLVNRVKRIILDNDWCEAQYRSFCPDLKAERMTLAVSPSFLKERWDISQARKNTVFCIAGRAPYKGLHQAIRAMMIVRQRIPDARLIIPGDMTPKGAAWLTRSPYFAYLDTLIEKGGLNGHILFCGRLNAEQMARQMLDAHAFVMPSCIENHSSTLREAMYLGMPCVSSLAGSVHELIVHGQNGMVYRYEEHEVLADHLIRILTQPELAVRMGSAAYESIRIRYPQGQSGEELLRVYESMLSDGRTASHEAMTTGS